MNKTPQCDKMMSMQWHDDGNIFRVTGHCAGNSPVTGEFPTQRPVTQGFDVFFDLRMNKQLSKQSWGWWFEMLWRHCNGLFSCYCFVQEQTYCMKVHTSHWCCLLVPSLVIKIFNTAMTGPSHLVDPIQYQLCDVWQATRDVFISRKH